MIIRAAHYFLGPEMASWIMLFADDGKILIPLKNFRRTIPALLSMFVIFGFDVKWKKLRGGLQFQWIGYWNDLEKHSVGISERRRAWVKEWIEAVVQGKPTEADFDSGLGRLSFVCGAIIYDRPFLAPLYAWAAAVRKRTGKKASVQHLPPFVKFTLAFLWGRLTARRRIHCSRGQPRAGKTVERFRTDAKAEGDTVTVGGYQTFDGLGHEIPHHEARWFFLKLNRKNAPWAFVKGEPFRAIASLELLGSLLGIMLLLEGQESDDVWSSGLVSVGGLTDNSGNRFAVSKLLTTKWPLSAFLCELAVQLEDRGILFEVQWAPREQNAKADAITNGVTDWLEASKEIEVDLKNFPFKVLHKLLAVGAAFYKDIDVVNIVTAEPTPPSTTLLKVRDPWD